MLEEKPANLSKVDIPKYLNFRFYQPGQYLVPLRKNNGKLKIINGYYSFPIITKKNKATYHNIVQEWMRIKDYPKAAFFEKHLSNKHLSCIHADSVKYLGKSGLFNAKKLLFWSEKMNDKTVTVQAKQQILENLSNENMQHVATIFLTALENDKLFFTAARYYSKHNKEGFSTLMTGWLGNQKLRNIALKNYHFISKDPKFATKATNLSASTNYKNSRLYLPYFFAPGNSAGTKAINLILKKGKKIPEIVQILKQLLRFRDKSYAEAALSCISKFYSSSQQGANYILAYGLAYLCSIGDAKGIAILKNKLQDISNNKKQQKLYLMTMTIAARKRFKDWQDYKNWCAGL